jgi:hypothetical protein
MPQAIERLLATPNTTPRLPANNFPPSAIAFAPLATKALYRIGTGEPEGFLPERLRKPVRARKGLAS